MRVFLDTNVLVSALATRGLCEDVLRLVLAEHVLMTGAHNLEELREVLEERFHVSPAIIAGVSRFFKDHATMVKPRSPSPLPIRDPDDRWVLAAAVKGKADVLVTGDKDLLTLGKRGPVAIIMPRAFWEMVTARPGGPRSHGR